MQAAGVKMESAEVTMITQTDVRLKNNNREYTSEGIQTELSRSVSYTMSRAI